MEYKRKRGNSILQRSYNSLPIITLYRSNTNWLPFIVSCSSYLHSLFDGHHHKTSVPLSPINPSMGSLCPSWQAVLIIIYIV
jgi:hypothetical protein